MNEIFYYAKKTIASLVQYVCTFLPIKKKTILFCSRGGVYSDNSKHVSIYLHKEHPELNQVFIISDHQCEELPTYIKSIPAGSLKQNLYLSTAQVIFDSGNTGGRGCFGKNVGGKTGKFLHKIAARKRKNQYSISLWHGTPLKKIGYDSLESSSDFLSVAIADYFIAGCEFTRQCLSRAFHLDIPVKMYGTPRNDIIFDKTVDKTKLKEKLHLPLDKNIILYAPTYRNEVMDSGVRQMNELDFEKLFDALHRKFGGEWYFVFRVHNNVMKKIDIASIAMKYGGRIIDGNIGDDMAEYLVCTDVLITDYSSSMFDFELTKKPCFLYAPDREYYEKVERGFYMEYDELPFSRAYTSDELVEQIESFDQNSYIKKIEKHLKDIGNVEDGHASERVSKDILHFIDTGEKCDNFIFKKL